MNCKHLYNKRCSHADCPAVECVCPVVTFPGLCRYYEPQPNKMHRCEFTDVITCEITRVHKVYGDPEDYERKLAADECKWIKIIIGADNVNVLGHQIFKHE